MANLSQQRRQRMLDFLQKVRDKNKDDDEALVAIGEIENELTEKKYGLVWEEHSEEVEEQMLNNVPVFVEDKEKEITMTENGYNFLLEGDNLHSLHLLEKTQKEKIDVIYIDPPYNTGKEFIYDDAIIDSNDGFRHSKWLSFMERRLRIAHSLLSENGVIFISIDDNEQAPLKMLCSEIFGESNFIAQIVWERAYAPVNLKKHFSESHDYVLCFAKNIESAICNGLPKTDEASKRYKNPDNDPRGPWKAADATVGPVVQNRVYELTLPSGRKVLPPAGRCWLYDEDGFKRMSEDNRVWYGPNGDSVPAIKKFASEVKQTMTPMTIWKYTEVGHSQDATKELKDLFGGDAVFSYPKSVKLMKRIIRLYSRPNSMILDFFAGSGTTGQAVLELNKEDGGNRRFILCTNNENNICEGVTYPRLQTVITGMRLDGNKYSDGIPADLKYYHTDYVAKDSPTLIDDLLSHIDEMIQLEYGVKIDKEKYISVLSDEDADELERNWEKYPNIRAIYVSRRVLLTAAQRDLFKTKECFTIPDYYFRDELKEAGEV